MDPQAECAGDLHDRGEARVAVSRERLVEPLTAHVDSARQFAEVAGASDGPECLGDERGIVAGLLEGGFQVRRNVLDAGQVVSAFVGGESLSQLIAVPEDPAQRPHRLVAGRSKTTGRCLAGEDCVSAVMFGPNGSGKTVALIIPNVLEWQGSVVMTTAKPQDLTPVLAARAALGPVWVVAPAGAPGVETAAWSPVDYAVDAGAADRMAE